MCYHHFPFVVCVLSPLLPLFYGSGIFTITHLLPLYCHHFSFVSKYCHHLQSASIYWHRFLFVAQIFSQFPISCPCTVTISHFLPVYCHHFPFVAPVLSPLTICCPCIVTVSCLLSIYCHHCPYVAQFWLSICYKGIFTIVHMLPLYYHYFQYCHHCLYVACIASATIAHMLPMCLSQLPMCCLHLLWQLPVWYPFIAMTASMLAVQYIFTYAPVFVEFRAMVPSTWECDQVSTVFWGHTTNSALAPLSNRISGTRV